MNLTGKNKDSMTGSDNDVHSNADSYCFHRGGGRGGGGGGGVKTVIYNNNITQYHNNINIIILLKMCSVSTNGERASPANCHSLVSY